MSESTEKILIRAAVCATLVCWWLASLILAFQVATGITVSVGH